MTCSFQPNAPKQQARQTKLKQRPKEEKQAAYDTIYKKRRNQLIQLRTEAIFVRHMWVPCICRNPHLYLLPVRLRLTFIGRT